MNYEDHVQLFFHLSIFFLDNAQNEYRFTSRLSRAETIMFIAYERYWSQHRLHNCIEWHIIVMPRLLLHSRMSPFPLYIGTILLFLHMCGIHCCSTWFMASTTYLMSCFPSILTASMGRSSGCFQYHLSLLLGHIILIEY